MMRSGCPVAFLGFGLGAIATVLLGCQDFRFAPLDAPTPARVPQPVETGGDAPAENLLQLYARRPPINADEPVKWQLPHQGKRVAVAMLITVGLDRLEDLALVLTPDAVWGLPDRRRVGARAVFAGDGGAAFAAALRKSARRFSAEARWTSRPVLLPGLQMTYQTGAEPMWSYWAEAGESLLLSMVVYAGEAKINYVGLWEDGPDPDIDPSAYGAAPPLIPISRPERIVHPANEGPGPR